MFASIARRLCNRKALSFADWGPELIQIGWEITLRKFLCYEPRGQLYSSYAYEWARAYMGEHLEREGRRAGRTLEYVEEGSSSVDGRAEDGPDPANLHRNHRFSNNTTPTSIPHYEEEELRVDLEEVDPLVLESAMGFSDEEIAGRLGLDQAEVTRRRKRARKELLASAVA